MELSYSQLKASNEARMAVGSITSLLKGTIVYKGDVTRILCLDFCRKRSRLSRGREICWY